MAVLGNLVVKCEYDESQLEELTALIQSLNDRITELERRLDNNDTLKMERRERE